ncbi:MAG: sulfatase-like hydrolase/transferase [Bacteroidota bacterium]
MKLVNVAITTIVVMHLVSCSWTSDTKPNIVIIYTDDQGTLDAGIYGAEDLHTTNIDRLGDTGIRFTQAYAHAVCCPSRGALLTGRHPQRYGITDWTQNDAHATEKGINMPLEEVTLAEILKANGYRTGIFGKWHLGASLENGPLSQGFDEFFGFRGGFIDNYVHYFLHGIGFHDLWKDQEEIFLRDQYFPSLMTEEALQFIDRNKDQPFFLYASFNLPHYPEQPDSIFLPFADNLEQPRKSYAAAIATVDDKIGQLIDKLEAKNIRDQTVIFFMSDNGHSTEETFIRVDNHTSGLPKGLNYCANGGGGYTGKWRGAKGSFLEGGIRVPTIVSYRGHFPEGEQRDQIISCMDFLPTICELTGSVTPDTLDGHSLLPIIESGEVPSRHETLFFEWRGQWAVRQGKWKLIVKGRDTTGKFSTHPEKEEQMESPYLANLEDENPEELNYASEFPEVVERLTNLYNSWYESVKPNVNDI